MKLSTRARYGTRAMIDLAAHEGDGPVSIHSIAQRQGISPKYLKQLLVPLKTSGLVRSIRGPKGGIALARPASEIKLIDVVQAADGSIAVVECVHDARFCARSGSCAARRIWTRATEAMEEVLGSVSLSDLTAEEALD